LDTGCGSFLTLYNWYPESGLVSFSWAGAKDASRKSDRIINVNLFIREFVVGSAKIKNNKPIIII